jgi:hypothetical protein
MARPAQAYMTRDHHFKACSPGCLVTLCYIVFLFCSVILDPPRPSLLDQAGNHAMLHIVTACDVFLLCSALGAWLPCRDSLDQGGVHEIWIAGSAKEALSVIL